MWKCESVRRLTNLTQLHHFSQEEWATNPANYCGRTLKILKNFFSWRKCKTIYTSLIFCDIYQWIILVVITDSLCPKAAKMEENKCFCVFLDSVCKYVGSALYVTLASYQIRKKHKMCAGMLIIAAGKLSVLQKIFMLFQAGPKTLCVIHTLHTAYRKMRHIFPLEWHHNT